MTRTVGAVLYNSPDPDWNDEGKMKGWGLGKLLPYDNVSDDGLPDV